MTFNTGNNVPSTDPRDLYDNAENLDKLVNGADPFYADRKGKLRESWAGMENSFNNAQEGRETAFTLSQADKESRFQAFLVSSGYVSKGDYAAGVVLEERNEYVFVSAATTGSTAGLYFPSGGAAVPLTLTGNWATDLPGLVLREEDALRQELAAYATPQDGAALVGRAIRHINSVAELRTAPGRYQDDTVHLVDYYGGWNAYATPHQIGSGMLSWDAISEEVDNGIDVFAVDGVATGRWKRPQAPDVPLGWGGIKGQDVDETALFVDLFAWADGKKVTLHGETGAQYRITNTARLNNSSLNFHGATLTFAHVGNNALLGLYQEAGIENVRVVCAGSIVGSVGNAGQRPIVGLDSKNCAFRNIVFDGVAVNNIAPLTILGDVDDIDVENISIPGSQLWAQGVIIHWATVADSAVADFKDIAYAAGASNATTHPRNIRGKNISCGTLTGGSTLTTALFLSGAYNVSFDNVTLDSAARLLTIYPGDYAADFAPAKHANKINTNIRISNIACSTVTGRGIVVGGLGVNSVVQTKTDVVIDGVQIVAPQTTYPLQASYCDGLVVKNGRLTGGQYVVALGESCKNVTLDNLQIAGGKERGVSSGFNNTTDNVGLTIRNCRIYGNNTDASTSPNNSGVYLERTYAAVIKGNRFGVKGGAETQRASVYVASVGAKLANNHTYSAAQGTAYLASNASPYSMDLWTSNDTSDTSSTTGGHVWYSALGFGNRRHQFVGSSGKPSGGTHKVGDELTYTTPVLGGATGARCISAPNTWATFGAISASAIS